MLPKTVWLYYSTENSCWVMNIARYIDNWLEAYWDTQHYNLTYTRALKVRDIMYKMAKYGLCDTPYMDMCSDGSVTLIVTIR